MNKHLTIKGVGTMKLLSVSVIIFLLVFNSGCNDRDESAKASSAAENGMKCGSGKCGAGMFDGNAALAKKKANIIVQMREDDTRRDCVTKAKNTKALYDCVRDPESGKLTKKCGVMKEDETMKCGAK